jgi:hypothetical protein
MKLTRRQFSALSFASLTAARSACAQQRPATKEVGWLKQAQTPPKAVPQAPLLRPLLADAQGNRLGSLSEWKVQCQQFREAWVNSLGLWQAPFRAPEFQIVEFERTGDVVRQLIRYDSEFGVPVEAYLLRPARAGGRRPGVVVFHSTVDYTIRQPAGLEGPPEAAWGLRLAERGFVALCPRCFLWDGGQEANYSMRVSEHRHRHRNACGMAKMLYDARRAVDVLASLPQVDAQRIGAAGHSLGGKEALYLAAFDERVRAAVASEAGIGTGFSNWDAPWYLGTKNFGHEHNELLGMIAPRAFLLIGGDSADGDRSWPFIASALDVYRFYNQPSRIGLFNHRQGHTIPPIAEQRTYEWLQAYL